MIDKEKVVNELADALKWCGEDDNLNGGIAIKIWAVKGAIALLKEHEAVKPIKMQRMNYHFSFFEDYFLCGNCKYELKGEDIMFCSHCGREVKWNDIR